MNELLKLASENFETAKNIRRHIHHNPELSFKEFDTAKLIRNFLGENGIKYRDIAGTGTVAEIGSGEKCVALRADIDALPIHEETNLDFASANDGIMHACGHDMHTTMLLMTAKILKEKEAQLNGKVMLIFQLAEESLPGGASIMLKEGLFDEVKPKMIFGQHINPGSTLGSIEMASGPVMASADELYWTIKGKSCHAAQPHLGNDPIIAASEMIMNLQNIMSRNRNPLEPSILSITSIHGGSACNIVPEIVELKGTLRSFNESWRKEALGQIHKRSIDICHSHGCECEFKPKLGYPALINSDETTEIAWNSAEKIFGSDKVGRFVPKMWAEDFAYYLKEIPGTFWFLGVRPEDQDSMPALHNSKLAPDEEALKYGISMFCQVVFDTIGK